MQRQHLQTMKRRGARFSQHRQARRGRRSAVFATLGVLAVLVVAGGVLWYVGTVTTAAERAARTASQASADATSTATPPASRPTRKPAAASASSRPETVTIAAVGDMVFDRAVRDLVASEGGAAPFSDVAEDLARADVTIGNLESVLTDKGSPAEDKEVVYQGHPDGIDGLTSAGFDFVALANNHVMDYGDDALAETLERLDIAGIAHGGAGLNQAAAWAPATYEKNGARFAYLAYSHIMPDGFLATKNRAGMASGKTDFAKTERAIRAAKKRNDYVVVSLHWGEAYESDATDEQAELAHRAIDAGADMVLAHHPHVIQGVEFYKDGLIAYSLGSFVYEHDSREAGEAFILHAELGPDGVSDVRAVPVYLDKDGAPQYVRGAEATRILGRLAEISDPYGTTVKVKGNEARLRP